MIPNKSLYTTCVNLEPNRINKAIRLKRKNFTAPPIIAMYAAWISIKKIKRKFSLDNHWRGEVFMLLLILWELISIKRDEINFIPFV